MRIRILTDSPSDVPETFVRKYAIIVVPVLVNFATESIADTEALLPRREFYRRLPNADPHPTTSAYSVGDAEAAMRAALADADHVLAVHIAPSTSSCIASSRLAAQNIGGDRVTVWDTGSLSMGAGWQVIIAAEMAAAGAELPQILAALHSTKERLHLWAAVYSLENLRRSGRVNWLQAGMGRLLDIKPMILLSGGDVKAIGRVRSFKKASATLIDYARSQAPLERIAFLHADNPQGAEEMRAACADILPEGENSVLIVEASAATGTHLGNGSLGIATVRK